MLSPLPGSVHAAAPNLEGFDCDSVLTATVAQAFAQAGFRFCARYLSRSMGQAAGDLSNAEATAILNAGLCLVAVQHVSAAGWSPDKQLGNEYGTNAASNAASIGLPSGMNIWCDLEGVAAGTSTQSVIDYCDAWYTSVANAGFVPGLYVGANCILNSTQLYDLSFQHYWKSLSNVPPIATRGYQMVQMNTGGTISGIGYDVDITNTDNLGGAVLWLAP